MRIILLLFVCLSLFTTKNKEGDTIVWDESRPLTWEDFKGKPEKRFAAASTHYDIKKNLSKINQSKAHIEIKAVFLVRDSWKKKKWINEQVLVHEQKHFDIVELFARKLRKEVLSLRYTTFDELLKKTDSLYTINEKDLDLFQDKYDNETNGSMNGPMQRQWNQSISDALKLLDDYKNNSFEITLHE